LSTGAVFAAEKELVMESVRKRFKTVAFEDGTHAVVRTDPGKPRLIEVVATFYDASRARDYADSENGCSPEQEPQIAPSAAPKFEPTRVGPDLSQRQSAVLTALRVKMNGSKFVEVKAAVLAEAANTPLGSLHSVLQSLEKKQLILTTRGGSARAPAVYQVLG
jgi:hypothetical protein